MQTANFHINDWEITKFIKFITVIQIIFLILLVLDNIGFQIPVLRQVVAFFYLIFIPGIVMLRILKIHSISIVELILYSVGLSIGILMFTGLFMNVVYPYFGISKPISLIPLVITISILVIILSFISSIFDKFIKKTSPIDFKIFLSPPALFLYLLPFLSIIGTYLMNLYGINTILMILIILIGLVAILVGFNRFLPKELFPLAVFSIAISLLFHASLISAYLWGWDIQGEFYFSNLVLKNGIWDWSIKHQYDGIISTNLLAPIFSILCNLELKWVFKIIYPLIFALVPLGLYFVFKKQTNDKIAFFSCFFFVSLVVFYSDMLQVARQEIAELFIVLLIMVLIDKKINQSSRSFLFVIFGISLAVSHYGLSYIYMFFIILTWILITLSENDEINKLKKSIYSMTIKSCFWIYKNVLSRLKPSKARRITFLLGNIIVNEFGGFIDHSSLKTVMLPSKTSNKSIPSTFVLLFVIFVVTWYMTVSNSTSFDAIVSIGNNIVSSFSSDFMNPETSQGLAIIKGGSVSILHNIAKYIQLFAQFLISIGILKLFLNGKRFKFEKEYKALVIINFVILIAAIAVPFVAGALNTTRLYQITLIILAPLVVVGWSTLFKILDIVFSVIKNSAYSPSIFLESQFKILSIFLVIFLLFNTGFVYEVANDTPSSISISNSYYPYFNQNEFTGAEWLFNTEVNGTFFAPDNTWLLLANFNFYEIMIDDTLISDPKQIRENTYSFFGTYNIVNKKAYVPVQSNSTVKIMEYINLEDIIYNRDKIYDNGGSQIHYG